MSFYRRSDVVYGFSASALGRKFFRLGGLTFYCYNVNNRVKHASQACFSRTHA